MNGLIFTYKTHKVLAWFVGIQVILWMLSGLIMSLFEIQTVRGSHLFTEKPKQSLSVQEIESLTESLATLGITENINNLSVLKINDERYYYLRTLERVHLVSVRTGVPLVIDESVLIDVFNDSYVGTAHIEKVQLLEHELPEIRGRELPIWQISLSDGAHVYMDPNSAQISAVRTRWWRVFDFFWMLHIMDYDERQDTSHPLLILAALSGLILAVSGMLMLVLKQIKILRHKKHR